MIINVRDFLIFSYYVSPFTEKTAKEFCKSAAATVKFN